MKTRIYRDTFCDENVSITRSKKYSLDKAVPKLCQTHFLLLHHIFMKKWWKCDGRQLVLIFWLTSFENSRHAKKLMINDNDDEEWAVWSQLLYFHLLGNFGIGMVYGTPHIAMQANILTVGEFLSHHQIAIFKARKSMLFSATGLVVGNLVQ